jgi:hypothetical protein
MVLRCRLQRQTQLRSGNRQSLLQLARPLVAPKCTNPLYTSRASPC